MSKYEPSFKAQISVIVAVENDKGWTAPKVIHAYIDYLRSNPSELEALVDDLMEQVPSCGGGYGEQHYRHVGSVTSCVEHWQCELPNKHEGNHRLPVEKEQA
jgi:hypothetical protein